MNKLFIVFFLMNTLYGSENFVIEMSDKSVLTLNSEQHDIKFALKIVSLLQDVKPGQCKDNFYKIIFKDYAHCYLDKNDNRTMKEKTGSWSVSWVLNQKYDHKKECVVEVPEDYVIQFIINSERYSVNKASTLMKTLNPFDANVTYKIAEKFFHYDKLSMPNYDHNKKEVTWHTGYGVDLFGYADL